MTAITITTPNGMIEIAPDASAELGQVEHSTFTDLYLLVGDKRYLLASTAHNAPIEDHKAAMAYARLVLGRVKAAPAGPAREIVWDRESGDYRLVLEGQVVGFARSYVEGEAVLDRLIADRAADTAVLAALETQMLDSCLGAPHSYAEACLVATELGFEPVECEDCGRWHVVRPAAIRQAA